MVYYQVLQLFDLGMGISYMFLWLMELFFWVFRVRFISLLLL